MTTTALVKSDHTGPRIRASKDAIVKAIEALEERGLSVGSLLIEGGKVRIIPAGIEQRGTTKKHGGPKPWK